MRISADDREKILEKTGGHCHICGGLLRGYWEADHVKPVLAGGADTFENYLPACQECNRLKWLNRPHEIKKILRLGVYAFGEVYNKTSFGKTLAQFYKRRRHANRRRRVAYRKAQPSPSDTGE